jgi:hypothetical protein
LLEREDELDLEEEATELEPIFSRKQKTGQAFSEGEWRQSPLRCPEPTVETVSGFLRYQDSVHSLPPSEKEIFLFRANQWFRREAARVHRGRHVSLDRIWETNEL